LALALSFWAADAAEAQAPRLWTEPTLSPGLTGNLSENVCSILRWSGEGQEEAASASGERIDAAKTEAVEWLDRILLEDALPDDLADRLIPVQGAIPSHLGPLDTIYAQWEVPGWTVRCIQNQPMLIVMATVSDSGPWELEPPPKEPLYFLSRACACLVRDPFIVLATTVGRVRQGEGVTWAKADARLAGTLDPERLTPGHGWASHLSWYTDGNTVVFFGSKELPVSPIDPQVIPDWF
jgi:hypothetical protein